jgi:hypothetical protein
MEVEMDSLKFVDEIDQGRRYFFGRAVIAIAATQLATIDSAAAQRGEA